MRVRIIFGLTNKGAAVPFHHQFLLSNLVTTLLHKDPTKFQGFYDFNFSGLKGQTKIGKDGLHFYSNKVTLVISSPREDFIEYIVQQMFRLQHVEIGKLLLIPLSVEQEATPVFKNESKFICISPVVVINPVLGDVESKRFLSPFMDEFSDLLYDSTMSRMEKAGYPSDKLAEYYKFQVVPDKEYLTKIKEEEKKFARIFPVFDKGEKYEVRGYTFPFVLYADPAVQEFVFNSGLGNMCHKGFGMLDMANQDPNERTTPYTVTI